MGSSASLSRSRNGTGHGLVREEKKRDETQTSDNNHRLPTCQPTACVCGLLDRVGDALAEERERLELKAIEMLKGPKRLVQPEPVDHAWWDDGSGVYSIG